MKKNLFLLVFTFILLFGLGASLYLSQNRQDIRNRAAEPVVSGTMPFRMLTKVKIQPGGSFITQTGKSTGLSALAYDQNDQPIWSGVVYSWGISSASSVGTLSPLNDTISNFTALHDGIGDIFVTASFQNIHTTGSVKVNVGNVPYPTSIQNICNTRCFADSDCTTGYCYQPPMPDCPPGMACPEVMPAKVCRNRECPGNLSCANDCSIQSCPLYNMAPGWCDGGTIVSGGIGPDGCELAPKCLRNCSLTGGACGTGLAGTPLGTCCSGFTCVDSGNPDQGGICQPMTTVYPSCTDTDGGRNYNQKGFLNYTNNPAGVIQEADWCDGSTVVEGVCNSPSDNTKNHERFNCPNGCYDGACQQACITPPPCVYGIPGPGGTTQYCDVPPGVKFCTVTIPPGNCSLHPLGDADCDGRVSLVDMEIFRREFNYPGSGHQSDFNGDGKVSLIDFEILRRNFGLRFPVPSGICPVYPTPDCPFDFQYPSGTDPNGCTPPPYCSGPPPCTNRPDGSACYIDSCNQILPCSGSGCPACNTRPGQCLNQQCIVAPVNNNSCLNQPDGTPCSTDIQTGTCTGGNCPGFASASGQCLNQICVTHLQTSCKSDLQCPAGQVCQATMGYGTTSPAGSILPTTPPVILQGICKVIAGGNCDSENDCASSLVCHQNANGVKTCTNPVASQCAGPGDSSCPSGYTCIQGCGSPVGYPGEPTPAYKCEANELAHLPRNCPICLSSNTDISTPDGKINVQLLKPGMIIFSQDEKGDKIKSPLVKVSRTKTPSDHHVYHLILSDYRELSVSSMHPLENGKPVDTLRIGDVYDGASVVSVNYELYGGQYTYDLLPDSSTGLYWANGILMGSTLK